MTALLEHLLPYRLRTGPETAAGTVKRTLDTADGVIAGTHLKRDGVTWNPVDPVRAAAFMAAAHRARSEMAV